MKLAELAERSGVPVSSIKYYLRCDLLPPGVKTTGTVAQYDDRHLQRLRLITALRQVIGVPIGQIAELTALIDDPATAMLQIMETAQTMAGQFDHLNTHSANGRERTDSAMAAQHWPDQPSQARSAVVGQLTHMQRLGITVSDTYLQTVTDAVGRIGLGDLDTAGSRDQIALDVAIGSYEHARLVVALLQLAQTSHSIQLFNTSPAPTPLVSTAPATTPPASTPPARIPPPPT